MPTPEVELVLFDLGGVLIDPGGTEPMRQLSGISDDEELWRRWLSCPWVRSLESGTCTPEAFASGIVSDWKLDIAPDDFLEQFARWPHPVLDGADELVATTAMVRPVGCLSNTNSVQWEINQAQWTLLERLSFRFVSFELGLVKPDAEIFEAVAGRLDIPRAHVLFLDDNAVNVEAARSAGFAAAHVRGVAAARAALEAAGVLAPS